MPWLGRGRSFPYLQNEKVQNSDPAILITPRSCSSILYFMETGLYQRVSGRISLTLPVTRLEGDPLS
jgi:hypothetical protein